jgi:hypothetical protein
MVNFAYRDFLDIMMKKLDFEGPSPIPPNINFQIMRLSM